MKESEITRDYLDYVREKCINCKKCTRSCDFLTKYEIDLEGFANREDLAYSCFYCQNCADGCPFDLNGRYIAQIHREKIQEPMTWTKLNKKYFPFRNKMKKAGVDIFFPGCNFTAFYPQTTKHIVELFLERGGDFEYECCGYPIYMTGDVKEYENFIEKLEKRYNEKNINRLVIACANCYYFFKNHTNIEVITIYQWLREEGLGEKIQENLNIYFPCPDRHDQEIFRDIEYFLTSYDKIHEKLICCGHGGLASSHEPELSEKFASTIQNEIVHCYCATCANNYSRNNESHHILSMILGIDEKNNPSYLKGAVSLSFKGRG